MVCLMLGEIGEVDMFRHLASVPIVEPQRPKNEWFIQCARVDRHGERNPSVIFLGLVYAQRGQIAMQRVVEAAKRRIDSFDPFPVKNIDQKNMVQCTED